MNSRDLHLRSATVAGHIVVQIVFATLTIGVSRAESVVCQTVFMKDGPTVAKIYEDFKKGAADFSTADSYARKLSQQSPSAQKTWGRASGAAHRLIPKQWIVPGQGGRVNGRRLVERVASLLDRDDLKFGRFQSTSSTKQAYESVFEERRLRFATAISASAIEDTLNIIASDLKAEQQKLNGFPLAIYLGGSFVNGKADIRASDIDLSVNNVSLLKSGVIAQWQTKINEALGTSSLSIEAHVEPPGFYGTLNTFVFEITTKGIRLFVYPPGSASDRILRPGQPTIYEW